jgi:hypothetical protein
MAIDKEVKRKITQDWISAFPQLLAFAQNKFYKIVGCCTIGIELVKLPHSAEYRPHFVIYPLWEKDVKTCLDRPLLMTQLYDKKGLQFNIPYSRHDTFFAEAVRYTKEQMPISFDGDVSIKKVLAVLNQYSNTSPLSAAPHYLQAKLSESKLCVALYTGDTEQIQGILHQIEKKHWDLEHFAMWKVDYSSWLNDLRDRVNRRAEFMMRIEASKQDKRLAKLKHSELLPLT